MTPRLLAVAVLAVLALAPAMLAQTGAAPPAPALASPAAEGPVGPSPYEVVRGWHKPFAEAGFAFGGNSGVFAESPDRIFVAQRGEFRLRPRFRPSTPGSPARSR